MSFLDPNGAAFSGVDEESCKKVCLQNCHCKAAFFLNSMGDESTRKCYPPSEVFSLEDNQRENNLFDYFNSSAYLKVQLPSPPPPPPPPGSFAPPPPSKSPGKTGVLLVVLSVILGSAFGGLLVVLSVTWCFVVFSRRGEEEEEEDCIDEVPGMPMRFTFHELEVATESFCKKLGEGGFGTIF